MWRELLFNAQNIKTSTPSAYLIKMPRGSRYPDYMFWHPAKLVKAVGGKGQFMALLYADGFVFRLFKNGQGRHNKREIIDRKTVTSKDIAEAFGVSHQAVSNAIAAHDNKPKGIPVLRPPQEVEVDESLCDQD